jgi:predicted DNA binding CopG/RHH family protein
LPQSSADSQAEATLGLPTALERNLKSASITIRLSKAESAQLRRRAAEAGLTVSAYLRSCTFEAESLRALVKDTLAQLRSAPVQDKRVPVDTARRSWFQWWEQFWSRMRASRRIVQA